ncbi:MAG: zinc-binding dehydrogenase [Armatimonadota bacterium]
MKSLKFMGNSEVQVVDAPLPEPGPGEMLIDVQVSALCGSEMGSFRSPEGIEGNGGHEFAGVVADPNGNADFEEGDRVGVHIIAGCGECRFCRTDHTILCDDLTFYGDAHAEYALAAARNCVKLPDDIDWATGVLIAGDAMGVAYHTAERVGIRGNDTVAVIGCGPIGLGHILLLDYYGARPIGVDLSEHRLTLGQDLGAVATVNAAEVDPVEALRELTGGGPDVCYECTGKPAGVELAFEAAGKAGKIAVNGEQPEACFNPSRDLIHKELTVYGAWYWRLCEFYEMVELVRQGLDVTRIVTHELPLEDAGTGYDLMAEAQCGKIIFRQW